ncbi:MAG: hypothetical protein M3R45_09450 [Pseudomonadota bacterium]|nr:hypothetical protein [Pseudomonadota bacterium]
MTQQRMAEKELAMSQAFPRIDEMASSAAVPDRAAIPRPHSFWSGA